MLKFQEEKLTLEATIKTEVDSFKAQLETRTKEERLNYNKKVTELTAEFDKKLEEERAKIMQHFEVNIYVLIKYAIQMICLD